MSNEIDTIEKAAFEVWCWQHSNTNSFNNTICYLYQKADFGNKVRLALGFPFLCRALEEWNKWEDPNEFYKKYGVIKDEN